MSRALGMVHRVAEGLAVLALAMLLVATLAQVFLRYVWRLPLTWATEFIQLCFVIVVFLGILSVAANRRLIAADILGPALSGISRRIHTVIVALVGAVVAGVLAWQSLHVALARADRTSLVIKYPLALLFVILALGMVGIAVFLLASASQVLRGEVSPSDLDDLSIPPSLPPA